MAVLAEIPILGTGHGSQRVSFIDEVLGESLGERNTYPRRKVTRVDVCAGNVVAFCSAGQSSVSQFADGRNGVGRVGHASLSIEAPPGIEPHLPLMAYAGAQKRIATAPCERVGEVAVGRSLTLAGMIDAVVVVVDLETTFPFASYVVVVSP